MLRNGLKMAQNLIKEGNNEVQARLLKKVLNQDVIPRVRMRVSTAITRREEFSLEKRELSLQMISKSYVVNTPARYARITLQKFRQN